MFVDIAGFTVTTSKQSREQNAEFLDTFDTILIPLIEAYNGNVVKSIGDALLLTFRSPTDAMLCSMALQDAMHEHNINTPEENKIHIRVAAHLGEVRIANDDIFGEPVNVAARIEGVAPSDEIYLSEAVFLAMNKAEVPAQEVGFKDLKGVSQSIRIYNIPRFTTHRLIPETQIPGEKDNSLRYPYGGMHNVRLSQTSHADKKRLRKPFIFAALGAGLALLIAIIIDRNSAKDHHDGLDSLETKVSDRLSEGAGKKTADPRKTDNNILDSSSRNDPTDSTHNKTFPVDNVNNEKISSYLKGETLSPSSQLVQNYIQLLNEGNRVNEEQLNSVTNWITQRRPPKTATKPKSHPKRKYHKKPAVKWNVHKAKRAYKAKRLSSSEYNSVIRKLKSDYKNKVSWLKQEYRSGKITKSEYKRKIRAAKREYAGQ